MGLYDELISFNVDSSHKAIWPKPFSFAILLKIQIEEKDIKSGMELIEVVIDINNKEDKIAKIEIRPEHLQNGKMIGITPKINNFLINSEGNLVVKIISLNRKGKEISRIESPKTEIIETVIDNL
jgi:hypothetical protein